MSCKHDVRQAILDNVFTDHVKGRHTFTRLSDNTVRIQNRADNIQSKAKSTRQAYAMAKRILKAVQKKYEGRVSGYIHATSNYDAVHVSFTVDEAYIEREYQKLPQQQKTDVEGEFYDDPEEYSKGTGIDYFGDSSLAPLTTTQGLAISSFKQLVEYKQKLIDILKQNEKLVKRKLKETHAIADRRKLLKRQNQIENRLKGDGTKTNPGLFAEVHELTINANTNAVGFYMEQDLARLKVLATSDNPEDIQEANYIVKFLEAAGTFENNVDNPFFHPDEIFALDSNGEHTSTIILDPATVAEYKRWADEATDYKNQIFVKEKELISQKFNEQYNTLIGKVGGIEDVDKYSVWLMDITQGISSAPAKFVQLAHKYTEEKIEEELNKGREINKRLNDMQPLVMKELSTINNGKYKLFTIGILGIKGVSFDLFMQKFNKSGRDTGKLVSMFSEEYNQKMEAAISDFFYRFNAAKTEQDWATKQKKIRDIHIALLNKKREESIVMDITKIPEIAADLGFSQFSKQFVNDNGAHKQELIDLLGQREYDNQVKEQKKLLYNYIAEREEIITAMLTQNGVQAFSQLSPAEQHYFNMADARINPFVGVEDFNIAGRIMVDQKEVNHEGKYNSYIPRKYKATMKLSGGRIQFTNTTVQTGNYNPAFDTIKNNKILYDFHELATEALGGIYQRLPPEMHKTMSQGTLPAHMKTASEILLTEKGFSRRLFPALQKAWDDFKGSWATMEQGNIADPVIDRKTGKPNYTLNSDYIKGNSGTINKHTQLEIINFIQVFNRGAIPANRITEIKRNTVVNITKFSPEAKLMLSEYLNAGLTTADIANNDLTKITDKVGENIPVHKAITEFVTHSVVQSNSYDLFKLLKLYTSLSSEYAAREEIFPFMEIAKRHYDDIQAPMLNKQGEQMIDPKGKLLTSGPRTKAVDQFEDWFTRVILAKRHKGFSTRITMTKVESYQDKKLLREIDHLLSTESNPKRIAQLQGMKKGIGKIVTSSSILDKLQNHVRFLGLAIAPFSAVKNGIDGWYSNMKQASSNEFYDGKHIYYAYKVSRYSRAKYVTDKIGVRFKKGVANKLSNLMARQDVLMDSRNEDQKSSMKTNFSGITNFNPYFLNTAQEYLNQSVVMISMLKTMQITGIDPKQTSSVWDAMDHNGNISAPFRTSQNVDTWEGMNTPEYHTYKSKLGEAITRAHGNYSELRGMKLKSDTLGKILMSMKTWLTSQIYDRVASKQYNEKTQKEVKGRFRSFTPATGATFGAIMATVSIGFPFGFATGLIAGYYFGKSTYGVKTDINAGIQLMDTARELWKRMVGMPVNMLAGKSVIATNKGYDTWVNGTTFTEADARNMRANVTELVNVMGTFMIYLLVRGLVSDDDDDKDIAARNFVLNNIVQMLNSSMVFLGPAGFWKDMVATPTFIRFIMNVSETLDSLQNYLEGDDVNIGGDNRGKSRIAGIIKKVGLPGLLRDPKGFGTASLTKRVYNDLRWGKYFRSENKKEADDIKRDRAQLKVELEEGKIYSKSQIKTIINERFPTQAKLKKKGMTRDQYEKQYGSTYELPEVIVPDEENEAAEEEKEKIKKMSSEEFQEYQRQQAEE